MGIALYLKPVNKDGRSLIYLRAKKGDKIFRKSLSVTVRPSDWISRTYQVKGTAINSVILNRKLTEITSNMNLVWSSFEGGIYNWDELCRMLAGGSPEEGVLGFLEDVLRPRMKFTTYCSYKYSYGALLKALGVDSLSFKQLDYDSIDKAVMVWKNEEKSPSTIETYIKHLGVIINEASDRGIINYRFEKKKKWRVKKLTTIVESTNTDELLNSIKNVNDIYDFQTFSFWLLMFCMRGLYPSDIVKMYKNELINEAEDNLNRYVEHKRSKTGERMKILYSCSPTEEIINSLQISISLTHLNRGERLPDVYPKGWHTLMFFEYPEELHKNVWDVYVKRCRRIVGMPFKTARKTFESYALLLDIPAEIRYRLLGHQDRTIKRHYQNWEWEKMIDKVDEAHLKVLEEFNVKKIWYQLRKRGNEIGLNQALINKSLLLGNPRYYSEP
tara:strand:- start:542 stop:1870 length:1329 start_codon:yes stop_codon:yes gene_type:complete